MSKIEKDSEIKVLKEETSEENTKNTAVVSQNTHTDSPKTPRSFMRRWIGKPIARFGCCLSPSSKDQRDLRAQVFGESEVAREVKNQIESDSISGRLEDFVSVDEADGVETQTLAAREVNNQLESDSISSRLEDFVSTEIEMVVDEADGAETQTLAAREVNNQLESDSISGRLEDFASAESEMVVDEADGGETQTLAAREVNNQLESDSIFGRLEDFVSAEIEMVVDEAENAGNEAENDEAETQTLALIAQLQASMDTSTTAMSTFQASVDTLTTAMTTLTAAITNNFARDPMEALRKERDELSKFVLAIGGWTTVTSFSSPPGGLDKDGLVRFRYTQCYWVYLFFSSFAFVLSYANLVYLHKPATEPNTLRKKIKTSWIGLWITVMIFFVAFTSGFWIVYPGKKQENPKEDPQNSPVHTTYAHNSWPRWFSLGLSIAKVVWGLAYIFGRRMWAACMKLC